MLTPPRTSGHQDQTSPRQKTLRQDDSNTYVNDQIDDRQSHKGHQRYQNVNEGP